MMKKIWLLALMIFLPVMGRAFSEVSEKKYQALSDFQNFYTKLNTEISEVEYSESFIETVIDRTCEREYLHCEALDRKTYKSLSDFVTKTSEVVSARIDVANTYKKVLQNVVEQETENLKWQYELERSGKLRQFLVDGDAGKKEGESVNYAEKNTPFDVVKTIQSIESMLFGKKQTDYFLPKFLVNPDSAVVDIEEAWQDASVWQVPTFESNGSIVGQLDFINKKIFSEVLNQNFLGCTRNTKKILEETACSDPLPTPKFGMNGFSTPAGSQDLAEIKVDAKQNSYKSLLEKYESQASCESLTFAQNYNSISRLQAINNCKRQRIAQLNQDILEKKLAFDKQILSSENQKRIKAWAVLVGTFEYFFNTESPEDGSTITDSLLELITNLSNKSQK